MLQIGIHAFRSQHLRLQSGRGGRSVSTSADCCLSTALTRFKLTIQSLALPVEGLPTQDPEAPLVLGGGLARPLS